MKRIVFITPQDAEPGFRLAGVGQRTAVTEETALLIREITSDPDVGLLVVDERLLVDFSREAFDEVSRLWHGIALVLPAPRQPEGAAEDYVDRLIRKAIGYHVRLKA